MRLTHISGVTLIELCVALTVVAVLTTLAAPGFRTALRTSAMRSAAYDLMGDLQQTRGLAILEGRSAVLCVAGAAGCGTSPAAGWLAFVELAGISRPVANRVLPEGLEIRASRARVTFRPNALAADAGTLTICDRTGIARPRSIVISRTGRPRFGTPATEECR